MVGFSLCYDLNTFLNKEKRQVFYLLIQKAFYMLHITEMIILYLFFNYASIEFHFNHIEGNSSSFFFLCPCLAWTHFASTILEKIFLSISISINYTTRKMCGYAGDVWKNIERHRRITIDSKYITLRREDWADGSLSINIPFLSFYAKSLFHT